ncbi:hypothetical protein [Segnochrobactrum spirostomi]|uniref:DUF1134 domain-containing protein n=1 Tax=Segnochrobactrum spirostomi TaxID=2608987 RepID=A0A6A7XXU2_9HYPH|nr:hypothetical protein [Segnochrobactrum spirostomi]MQT11148.1 hypothetical protein [Segnochrobactrum spirostomi]
MPSRRRVASGLAAVMVAVAVAGGATLPARADDTFEGKKPVGTISLKQFQAGYLASAGGGEGVLVFDGHKVPFSIGGLGVGGVGAAETEAEGYVYGLTNLAQFPGNYVQVRTGFAIGTFGGGDLTLRNKAGVVLKLKAHRKGLMLGFGGDVISVTLKETPAQVKAN